MGSSSGVSSPEDEPGASSPLEIQRVLYATLIRTAPNTDQLRAFAGLECGLDLAYIAFDGAPSTVIFHIIEHMAAVGQLPTSVATAQALGNAASKYDPDRILRRDLSDPRRVTFVIRIELSVDHFPPHLIADIIERIAQYLQALVEEIRVLVIALADGIVRLLGSAPVETRGDMPGALKAALTATLDPAIAPPDIYFFDRLSAADQAVYQVPTTSPAPPAAPELRVASWIATGRQQASVNDLAGLARTNLGLGDLYSELNQPEASWRSYAVALGYYTRVGAIAPQARIHESIANLAHNRGALTAERVHLEQALTYQLALGNADEVQRILQRLVLFPDPTS